VTDPSTQGPAAPVTAVVVLAAGGGTRMRSQAPKVLHRIGGRSLVGHVLAAVDRLDPAEVVVVVGHGRDAVAPHVLECLPRARTAVQKINTWLEAETGGDPQAIVAGYHLKMTSILAHHEPPQGAFSGAHQLPLRVIIERSRRVSP